MSEAPRPEEFGRKGRKNGKQVPWFRALPVNVPTLFPRSLSTASTARIIQVNLYKIAKRAEMRISTLVRGDEVWVLRREDPDATKS